MHVGGGYSWSDPGEVFRYAETGGAVFQNFDYGGNVTWRGAYEYGNLQLLNYYNFNWNLAYNPQTFNNYRTRGGPLTLNPPGYQIGLDVSSDSRKSFQAEVSGYTYQSGWQRDIQEYVSLIWRPAANISVSIAPTLDHDFEAAQWVTSASDPTATATYGDGMFLRHGPENAFSEYQVRLDIHADAQPAIVLAAADFIRRLQKFQGTCPSAFV